MQKEFTLKTIIFLTISLLVSLIAFNTQVKTKHKTQNKKVIMQKIWSNKGIERPRSEVLLTKRQLINEYEAISNIKRFNNIDRSIHLKKEVEVGACTPLTINKKAGKNIYY